MSNGFSLAATAEPKVATPGLNKTTMLFVLMAVAGVGAGQSVLAVWTSHGLLR